MEVSFEAEQVFLKTFFKSKSKESEEQIKMHLKGCYLAFEVVTDGFSFCSFEGQI